MEYANASDTQESGNAPGEAEARYLHREGARDATR
jgi:hypothetical protein